MDFLTAGYQKSSFVQGDVAFAEMHKEYTTVRNVVWFGPHTECVEVSVLKCLATGSTNVEIKKDGQHIWRQRSRSYRTEGIAFRAVEVALEYLGYKI